MEIIRIALRLEDRLSLRRTLGIGLQRKGTVGVNMPDFRQCHSPAREFWTWISALSSFTAPALALAMCLRTASVVSSTRVLGRWNLRVAVDSTRQRPYRLRRVCSAANTSSDLIALIAPVKDFKDPQSTFVTTRSQSHIFLRRRDGRTFRYGRLSVGRAIRRKLEAYWGCSRLFFLVTET